MSITLHDITAVAFVRGLTNMGRFLKKGEDWANENGVDHSKLLHGQLNPDMKDLIFQVQRASDSAKLAMVRLGKVENEVMEDNEKTFADLQARIAKTIAFVQKASPEAVNSAIDVKVEGMPAIFDSFGFVGKSYSLLFAMPNFYFHETATYAILRMVGVPVGKADYIGAP